MKEMKLKKTILILLLTFIIIALLQLNVNAEENAYTGYDYLLTKTGEIVEQKNLVGTETIIAGVKGTSANGLSLNGNKITIKDFTAEKLVIFDEEFSIWIEGSNSVYNIYYTDKMEQTYVDGYGKIITNSSICGPLVVTGYAGDEGDGRYAFFIGGFADSTVESFYVEAFYIDILASTYFNADGSMNDHAVQLVCNYIEKVADDGLVLLTIPKSSIIPSKIFSTLKLYANKTLYVGDDSYFYDQDSGSFRFKGSEIQNSDSNFKLGLTWSSDPIEGMPKVEGGNTTYIKFNNTYAFKGWVTTDFGFSGGGEEIEEDAKLKSWYLYYYNEDIKLYEFLNEKELFDGQEPNCFTTNHPYGKYVLTDILLPNEMVSGENAKKDDSNQSAEETNKGNNENEKNQEKETTKTEDNTTAPGSIPYAGGTFIIIVSLLAIAIVGIYTYKRNNDLKGI